MQGRAADTCRSPRRPGMERRAPRAVRGPGIADRTSPPLCPCRHAGDSLRVGRCRIEPHLVPPFPGTSVPARRTLLEDSHDGGPDAVDTVSDLIPRPDSIARRGMGSPNHDHVRRLIDRDRHHQEGRHQEGHQEDHHQEGDRQEDRHQEDHHQEDHHQEDRHQEDHRQEGRHQEAAKKTTKKAATKKAATRTATKKTTKKAATKSIEAEVETDETVESPADDAAVEAADTDSDSGESGSRRKKTTRKSSRKSEGKSAGGRRRRPLDRQAEVQGRRDRRRPGSRPSRSPPPARSRWKGSRLMLVDEVPGESCRIGILENGRLEELFVERAQSSTAVGNIYKARVVNVERAIKAAFVDYGQGMNGFLHVSDLHPRYFPGGDKTEKVGRKTPRRGPPADRGCPQEGPGDPRPGPQAGRRAPRGPTVRGGDLDPGSPHGDDARHGSRRRQRPGRSTTST